METGLKSRLLPHRRVLITVPDRTVLGKRGLDLRPGGSGGVFARSLNSRGGGGGIQGGGGRAARTNRLKMAEDVLSFYPAAVCTDWARK